jgi:hypothetical protein
MLLTALAIHRPGVAVAGIVASVLCGCMPVARAETFSGVTVDSKSNIYASGLASTTGIGPNGPGLLPPFVTLPSGVGRVLQFSSVSGTVSYNNVDAPSPYLGQYNGPDGGAVWFADANFPSNFLTSATPPGLIDPAELGPDPSRPAQFPDGSTTFYVDMDSNGGISGMNLFESAPADRRVMFLAGVFLTDAEPTAPAPVSLDFSSTALGRSFVSLAPLLQQTFYIGDGLTAEGTGTTQSFLVPDGATRLFLGIVDGSYFVGGPDYYDNNDGAFTATFTVAAVPEPSACVLALIAMGLVGMTHARTRSRIGR